LGIGRVSAFARQLDTGRMAASSAMNDEASGAAGRSVDMLLLGPRRLSWRSAGPARADAGFQTETGLARRIELMTFYVAVARGQQFERSRIPCKRPLSSSRCMGRFAAGPGFGPARSRRTSRLHARKRHANAGLSEAAEGIRTLDPLHGKQSLGEGRGQQRACKQRVLQASAPSPVSAISRRFSGV
jgi:hypothetical protein